MIEAIGGTEVSSEKMDRITNLVNVLQSQVNMQISNYNTNLQVNLKLQTGVTWVGLSPNSSGLSAQAIAKIDRDTL